MYISKFTLIFFTVILVISCNYVQPEQEPSEEIQNVGNDQSEIIISRKQFVSSGYELGKVERRAFEKTISVFGSIHIPKRNIANVGSFLSGTVDNINLLEGQWVKKGQVLFTITNPDLIKIQEDYLVAREERIYKISESERLAQLLMEKLTTKNELTKVNYEVRRLDTKIASLQKQLDLIGIDVGSITDGELKSSVAVSAPMSGYVTSIKAVKGMYLESQHLAIELMNTNHKHLELQILEKDIHSIAKGQKISFYLQGDPEIQYSAEVYLINPFVNADHMIQVHCHLEEKDLAKLIPGMYVSASIVLNSLSGLSLPTEAVVDVGDRSVALRLINDNGENMIFEMVDLDIGDKNDNYTEIIGEVDLENQYLTQGTYFIIK